MDATTYEERRQRFAREMSEVCGCDVVPVGRPELAAHEMDIIITATSSREAVLHGSWIAEGTHMNVVGSNFLAKSEIDVETIRRAEILVVDSKDQARLEAGDFVAAMEEGVIHWSDIYELGQVIVGRYPGRSHPQDITLFKSLGIALEDVAVAGQVFAKAQEQGVGRWIEW